jgi:gliding motility-associated-like protein
MNKLSLFFKIIFILLCGALNTNAQITIVDSVTANTMAQMIAGPGVTVSNAFFNADCDSNLQAGLFYVTTSNLGLDSGIILSSGHVATNTTSLIYGANGIGSNFASTSIPPSLTLTPDTLLSNLILIPSGSSGNNNLYDRCALEFDFVPQGDTVKFDYVFASEEFPGYSCSQFTDVFGFFITGPSIPLAYNMAVIPGTTLPVMINTINGGGNLNNWCTQYGVGSPFTSFFVNNANGTSVTYSGMTTVLPTKATAVTACQPHHLKIEIADVGDESFDSGVFIKAGSLTSNAITLTPIGALIAPTPYVVEGCAPGGILVSRPVAAASSYTVHYTIGGTATNGVDYTMIADSVVILPNQTTAVIPIVALADALNENAETVTIYRTASCSGNVLDSTTVTIFDSLQMRILSNDTSVCAGKQVKIQTLADPNLSVVWTPNINISNPTSLNPIVAPTVNTWYLITASLAGSGCPPVKDSILININPAPTVSIGPDVYLCKNMTNQFAPTVTPTQAYTYSWSSSTFLSSGTVLNPLGTFTTIGTYTYVLTASPNALGCVGRDTVLVEVLPNDIVLLNKDTNICDGQFIKMNVVGDPRFSYVWAPLTGLSNAYIASPFATPTQTTTYNVVATYPGCPNMGKSVKVTVEPVPLVSLGADREICIYDTVRLFTNVQPDTFTKYSYKWLPALNLNNDTTQDVIFSGLTSATYTVTVTTPLAKCVGTDAVNIIVWPTNFTTISGVPATVCPNISVPLTATGAISYHWEPNWDINNNNIANPIVNPVASVTYTLYATSIHGCIDTNQVYINRVPSAIIDAGPDVTLYPGDVYVMPTVSNCSQFAWAPVSYLDFANISNPTISNAINSTQYVVSATTENNCSTTDTVTVTVSPITAMAIANAFTPGNGTSPNNYFKIDKLGIGTLQEFRIYNRWGQMVYESTNINAGWNGKIGDVPQPMGVYIYNIKATLNNGTPFVKTGNVSLIR